MQKPIIFQSFTKVFADSQIQAAFCKVEVSEILKHTFCGIIQNTLEIICQQISILIVHVKIICAPKMRNVFLAYYQNATLDFLYCSPYSYCSSKFTIVHFCIGFVHWFTASFLYCSLHSYLSYNYCEINRCRSFSLSLYLDKR